MVVACAAAAMLAPVAAVDALADPCIAGLICTSSPSPSPSPSSHPSPSPTAKAAPKPTQAPAPAPAAQKPTPPAASPSPVAAQVAAQFQNAPFLSDLLSVLSHPASAQAPDLKHFRLDAATAARAQAAAVAAGRARQGARDATALALLGAWVLASLGLLAWWRAGTILPAWTRRVGVLAVPAALLALSSGLHVDTVRQPPLPQSTRTRAVAAVPRPSPSPTAAAAMAPDWIALVSVESEIARAQDVLKAREDAVRAMAASPDTVPDSVDTLPDSSNPDRSVRLDPEAQALRKLTAALDSYHAAAAAYQDTLRREYELYRGAAQDPARKEELVTAASATPKPEVADAVNYNLTIIQAQLDQEAAIQAAEARLQAIGSLSGSQLAAIRQHQAFIIPVEAPIIQGFGPTDFGLEPAVTYNGTFYPHFHTGIDIVGPENTPVHAAADGVVLLATNSNNGYGNYVVIAHPDGFVTLYGHMNSLSVKEGDLVHQGQIVGQEGSTGLSTGPHVHFEIRHNGVWVDPEPYLTGQANT